MCAAAQLHNHVKEEMSLGLKKKKKRTEWKNWKIMRRQIKEESGSNSYMFWDSGKDTGASDTEYMFPPAPSDTEVLEEGQTKKVFINAVNA